MDGLSLIRRGPWVFGTVWFGQVVSVLGSGLTSFALSVWVFQETGSVTQFAMVALFSRVPRLLLFPIAGVVADRWDRRAVMILADSGAAVSSLAILLLAVAGDLAIWHVYLLVTLGEICTVFQWPAWSSSISLLLKPKNLARANGLSQFGSAGATTLAPLIAGALLPLIGLEGIILADLSTFLVALVTLGVVVIPRPKRTAEGAKSDGKLLHQVRFAWRYIRERKGLSQLLGYFAMINFVTGLGGVLFTPLVLSFAGAPALGLVVSIGSVGMMFGGLLMGVTGGPKKRIYGVLGFGVLGGASMILAGLRPSVPLVALAAFTLTLGLPVINGCSQAIWQSKVDADLQGRVFSLRLMIAQSTAPLAFILAGPLADQVFEPAMMPGGALAAFLGPILGVGEGRGVALMYVLVGILPILGTLIGLRAPRLRFVEAELPDIEVEDGDVSESEDVVEPMAPSP
ncbi:MAG: MFS transporter [bacterium]